VGDGGSDGVGNLLELDRPNGVVWGDFDGHGRIVEGRRNLG
jgi:hypothetical protein